MQRDGPGWGIGRTTILSVVVKSQACPGRLILEGPQTTVTAKILSPSPIPSFIFFHGGERQWNNKGWETLPHGVVSPLVTGGCSGLHRPAPICVLLLGCPPLGTAQRAPTPPCFLPHHVTGSLPALRSQPERGGCGDACYDGCPPELGTLGFTITVSTLVPYQWGVTGP